MQKSLIKRTTAAAHIPRLITLIAIRLGINKQPNKGSSLYKVPGDKHIPKDQKSWQCPIGTLRLSDHWNYTNQSGREVFNTTHSIPSRTWALCINTGHEENPWKVLDIFQIDGSNILRNISFPKIEKEIRNVMLASLGRGSSYNSMGRH